MQKRAFEGKIEIVSDCIPMKEQAEISIDKHYIHLPTDPISFLHYHNTLEIGICASGAGLFYSYLDSGVVNQGDIVFFLPGDAHFSQTLNANVPCVCKFIYINTEASLFHIFKEYETGISLISRARGFHIPPVIRESENPQAYRILSTLISDALEQVEDSSFFVAMHLSEFLMKIPHFFKRNEAALNQVSSDDSALEVQSFISSHYNEPLTSERLSAVCRLSESQLRRKFKEKFGISPIKYVHLLRCNIAAQLLRYTAMPIGEIAQKMGYIDCSEFYKHFKCIFLRSPAEYRKSSFLDTKASRGSTIL